MASTYIKLPPSSGGGGGAVDSVNGLTGVVVLTKSNIGLGNVNNTSDATKDAATATLQNKKVQLQNGSLGSPSLTFQSDTDTGLYTTGDGNLSFQANSTHRLSINQNDSTFTGDLHITGNLDAANFPPTGTANTFAGFDGSGAPESIPGFFIDTTSGGMNEQLTESPDNVGGGFSVNTLNVNYTPLQNSPNDTWAVNSIQASLDVDSSGFTQGTSGEAVVLNNLNINHQGTGNVGSLVITKNNYNLGNGTDPITVQGIAYSYGFGTINSGVTLTNQTSGYTFQPNVQAGATINSDFTAFADYTNSAVPMSNYVSARLTPQLNQIKNNCNLTSLEINPQVSAGFAGNAGYSGVSMSGNLGAFGTGGVNAIYVNPTATNVSYGYGLFVDSSNIDPYPGSVSSLVFQDLTYTFNLVGDNNSATIEYVDDGTAGAETFNVAGNSITCHMESGVSTATQILAAALLNVTLSTAVTVTISGTGSNTQVTAGPTNFTGGTNPGVVKAGYFKGDVQIDGALAFTGGLSVGALQSFASIDISAYPPGVNSIDTLITQPTVAASTTLNTDLLSINTAMLLTVGAGSTLTSSFLGYTALGLPAVVSLGAGSTIDLVTGATFAISLDGSAGAGSSIAEVDLCRAIAIPNGITTVTKLVGYKMDLPFGDPGTTTYGVYITPTCHNYMAGDLIVGDSDVPTNSSVGIELDSTTKAFLNARMTTTERDALTAVNGMQLYNTTTNKLQVYAAGSWVDLH